MPADSAGFPGVVLGLPTIGPKGLQHRVTDAGHRFDKLGLTLIRLELERETFLTDGTELRVEASLCAALETDVTLESNQSAADCRQWHRSAKEAPQPQQEPLPGLASLFL